jgi:hypothetical protein
MQTQQQNIGPFLHNLQRGPSSYKTRARRTTREASLAWFLSS